MDATDRTSGLSLWNRAQEAAAALIDSVQSGEFDIAYESVSSKWSSPDSKQDTREKVETATEEAEDRPEATKEVANYISSNWGSLTDETQSLTYNEARSIAAELLNAHERDSDELTVGKVMSEHQQLSQTDRTRVKSLIRESQPSQDRSQRINDVANALREIASESAGEDPEKNGIQQLAGELAQVFIDHEKRYRSVKESDQWSEYNFPPKEVATYKVKNLRAESWEATVENIQDWISTWDDGEQRQEQLNEVPLPAGRTLRW